MMLLVLHLEWRASLLSLLSAGITHQNLLHDGEGIRAESVPHNPSS